MKNLPALSTLIQELVPMAEPEPRIYKIVRFRQDGTRRNIRKNVTLTEARSHCSKPETRGVRAGVRWFDGYEYMRGCSPKND